MYRRTVGTLLTLLLLFMSTRISFAEGTPNPSKIAKNVEPAVVLVQATFEADVEVIYPYLDQYKLTQTLNNVIQQVMLGFIPADESAMLKAAADELRARPLEYLQKSGQKEVVHTGYHALGSGFIVTPDGYVVTNTQVVAPDEELLKKQLCGPILEEYVNSFVAKVIRDSDRISANAQKYAVEAVTAMAISYFEENIKVNNLKKTVSVGMGVQIPGTPLLQKGLKTAVVQASGAVPKNAVAVLKIEGQENLPTLSFAAPTQLATGNQITVLGYNDTVPIQPLLAEASPAHSRLMEGIISVMKIKGEDWHVLQTKAAHGYSSGPVFNAQGQVLGLATAGPVDQNGINFVIPMTVIQESLVSAKVKPAESSVTKTYHEALVSYDKQHYQKALKKFQEVAELCPSHPYVQAFIDDSTQAISEGRDKSIPDWLLYGVPALVMIGLVVALVLLNRKKKAVQLAAAEADKTTEAETCKQQENKEQKPEKSTE